MHTLRYNNRNTPKHKGHKTQQPLYPFPHPTTPFPNTPFLVLPLPITQISISSLITITLPQLPLFIDTITKGFSIQYVNKWFGIEPVNLLLLNYISRPETEREHQPSSQANQSQHKIEIRERKQAI
jgi:hypothetical protein